MSEYIKRDDVIDLLEQVLNAEEFFDTDNAKAQSDLALWFEERISELPSVDAVEVVRCKDCKHHEELLNNNGGKVLCWVHGLDVIVDRNGYCNYGEREEQEPEQSIAEWQKDFRGYINMLDIPRDDYRGIMEYINEVPSAQSERG